MDKPASPTLQDVPADGDTAIAAAADLPMTRGIAYENYAASRHEREAAVSTFLGNGVALLPGTHEANGDVLDTGIVVMQYPDFGYRTLAGDNRE